MFGCDTHLLKHIKQAILAWLFRQNIFLGCFPVFPAISAPDEFIVPPRPPLTTACCGAARGGRVAVSGPRPRCWPRRCCCCLLAAPHRGSDRTGSAIERKYAGHSRHSPEWTADSRYLLTVFSFHLSLPKQCQGYQTHSQLWLTIHIAESEQSQW